MGYYGFTNTPLLDLRTDRLRRIADILWTRAQTRAKTKRLAAGGVESEGGMNLAPIPAELEPVHD